MPLSDGPPQCQHQAGPGPLRPGGLAPGWRQGRCLPRSLTVSTSRHLNLNPRDPQARPLRRPALTRAQAGSCVVEGPAWVVPAAAAPARAPGPRPPRSTECHSLPASAARPALARCHGGQRFIINQVDTSTAGTVTGSLKIIMLAGRDTAAGRPRDTP